MGSCLHILTVGAGRYTTLLPCLTFPSQAPAARRRTGPGKKMEIWLPPSRDWKSLNEVWLKCRTDQKPVFEAPRDFFGAKKATQNVHPIIELSAENCTEQMGVPGPWYERLPHFRMGFTPSAGKELQSEYFVPRQNAVEAIFAIERLHEQISPHLLITEIRAIAADELWMSPCYKQPSANCSP